MNHCDGFTNLAGTVGAARDAFMAAAVRISLRLNKTPRGRTQPRENKLVVRLSCPQAA